jgi:hypothetical protein
VKLFSSIFGGGAGDGAGGPIGEDIDGVTLATDYRNKETFVYIAWHGLNGDGLPGFSQADAEGFRVCGANH